MARTWFEPADEREHDRAPSTGEPDYCINCRRPFMDHHNGECPADEEDE